MRKFEQSKKGIVEILGKQYKVNVDDSTLSIVLLVDMPRFKRLQDEINTISKSLVDAEIDEVEYGERLEIILANVEKQCITICSKLLGKAAVAEIIDNLDLPTTVDYTNLVTMLAEELGDIRKSNNEKLLKGVEKYD